MTQINLDVEFSLTIHEPGIVPMFLAWVKANEDIDETNGWPHIGQLEERWMNYGPFDSQRSDVYQAGQWLVAIPKEPFRPELKDAILYVHIFPNVPMQVFYKDFPRFLKALGIERFEMRMPRYLECVKQAVIFLESGIVNPGEPVSTRNRERV